MRPARRYIFVLPPSYEDLERRPNDLEAAMQRLQDMIELGHLELGAHEEFDMLLVLDVIEIFPEVIAARHG